MCRLTIYKGRSLLLGDLIIKPENSILCQSRDAAYHPGVDDKTHLRNIRVNGDGCGVGFYGPDPGLGACMFRFVTPAWSNKNLRNLGDYVHSNVIMAHVRAASSGHDPHEQTAVSIENCHPFKYKQWSFMHNGGIPQFRRIKRPLLNLLSEDCFQDISGSTDSEHIFALFLNLLPDRNAPVVSIENFVLAVRKTIAIIIELCDNAGIADPCSLNLCITDGTHIIATRYRNGADPPPSLYYNYGCNFDCRDGKFSNTESAACDIVISSAPLSREDFPEEDECQRPRCSTRWMLMPRNQMLVCTGDPKDISKVVHISLKPIGDSVSVTEVTEVSVSPCPRAWSNSKACTESLMCELKSKNGLTGLGSDLIPQQEMSIMNIATRYDLTPFSHKTRCGSEESISDELQLWSHPPSRPPSCDLLTPHDVAMSNVSPSVRQGCKQSTQSQELLRAAVEPVRTLLDPVCAVCKARVVSTVSGNPCPLYSVTVSAPQEKEQSGYFEEPLDSTGFNVLCTKWQQAESELAAHKAHSGEGGDTDTGLESPYTVTSLSSA